MQETLEKLVLPEILPASDEAVVAYLRHSYKFAEMAALAERDTLILAVCQQLGISISDEELIGIGNKVIGVYIQFFGEFIIQIQTTCHTFDLTTIISTIY